MTRTTLHILRACSYIDHVAAIFSLVGEHFTIVELIQQLICFASLATCDYLALVGGVCGPDRENSVGVELVTIVQRKKSVSSSRDT